MKLGAVELEHFGEPCHFCRKVCTAETGENHAGMRLPMAKHQLAKVSIVRDHHSPLPMGQCEDLLVGQIMRMLAADPYDVVAPCNEVGDETGVEHTPILP